MHPIDLSLITINTNGALVATLSGGGRTTDLFPAMPDQRVRQARDRWFRQFHAYFDAKIDGVTLEAVGSAAALLVKEMKQWLHQPEWEPVHRVLNAHPGAPLRLRISEQLRAMPQLEFLDILPWEICFADRPMLRLGDCAGPQVAPYSSRPRRPRVLLLIGGAAGLSTEKEKAALTTLQSQRRIDLKILEEAEACLKRLREALADPRGWDVFLFVGHGKEKDSSQRDGLLFGDGTRHQGEELADALRPTTRRGLHLALLNCCGGDQIARCLVRAGVDWVHCFVDRVPDAIAADTFQELLERMEQGASLTDAAWQSRQGLGERLGGCELLGAIYCRADVHTFLLPLRKRQQFLIRLKPRRRHWTQYAAAGGLAVLTAWISIDPVNPLQRGLLDQRLALQRWWRQATVRPWPARTGREAMRPLPVLLLGQEAFTPQANGLRVSRNHLAKLIETLPAGAVNTVGLDFVLDEETPGTTALAEAIRRRQDLRVVAGFFGGGRLAATNPGKTSRLHPELRTSGLIEGNLSIQIPQPRDPSKRNAVEQYGSNPSGLRVQPLQLAHALTGEHFAEVVSGQDETVVAAHSIIDWSLDWFGSEERGSGLSGPTITALSDLGDLSALKASVLIVGRGNFGEERERVDLFRAPRAWAGTMGQPPWEGIHGQMPGALVQAVLVQSLRMGHWLRPLPPYPLADVGMVLLAAGGGMAVSAAQADRTRRLALLLAITTITIPLALEVAVRHRLLLPLALPLTALWTTTLLRREGPRGSEPHR